MGLKKSRNEAASTNTNKGKNELIGFGEMHVNFELTNPETGEKTTVTKRTKKDIFMYSDDAIMAKMVELKKANPDREFTVTFKVKPYDADESNNDLDNLS